MGKENSGKAANEKRTLEERKALSAKMLESKRYLKTLPKSAYEGVVNIFDIHLSVCVLDDGRRLVSEADIQEQLGGSGGKSLKLRKNLEEDIDGPLPLFLASKPLIPLIKKHFYERDLEPVIYRKENKVYKGYSAEIIPKVCEVWLEARDKNLLQAQQLPKAKKAEILVRGFARVGLIALIDEATGYQKDRERDALAKILEAFVAKELQPYMKTFDAEYYQEIFRLRGLPYPPKSNPNFRPQYFGILTNDIVYDRLAPGVKEALKKEAHNMGKSCKYHQFLTANYGRQELIKHIAMCIGFMKISNSWEEFKGLLDRVKPKYNQLPLDINK